MPGKGDMVGHFRLLEQIGAGGMGVVYRARDERIDRDVALKLIPPHLLDDPVARKRFEQEARTLSRLSHPNVAALYEFDSFEGQPYLVMELLSGVPLLQKLANGPLPLPEFYALATQLAGGLAAAHAVGIVHRDLKPGNILITAEGHLKILDFGLATFAPAALATAAGNAERLTQDGAFVGTLPYMSPEQLLGRTVDARSDLYSTGVVLYEMVTGHLPFPESGQAIVDAILNHPAQPPSRHNQHLPPGLDTIVLKALEKSPDRRYQSAREISTDLERLSVGIMPRPAPTSQARRWRLALGMLAAAALVVGGLWLGTRRSGGPAHVEFVQLTHFTDAAGVPAISPDGRMLAYLRGQITFGTSAQRNSQIWVQLLPNGQPTQLTNNEPAKNWPAFSPDGSRLAYTIQATGFGWDTWEVPPLGGEARQLMPNASGLTWLGDRLLYSKVLAEGVHMAIATSSPSRTDERTIYAPPGAASMAHRSFLSPDGKLLLVVEMDSAGTWLPCRVLPFDGSSAGSPVGPPNAQCTAASWSPDGRWMYFSSNVGGAFHLWRQSFPNGQPEQLTFGPTEEEGIAVAADGKSLLTAAGTRSSTVWIHDTSGDRQITSEGFSLQPSLSPDRKTVYYVMQSATTPHSYVSGELWRADVATGKTEPALPGVVISHYSISPDSRRVLYTTDTPAPGGLWIADLDHRTSPRSLTHRGESRGFFGASGEIIFQENNSLPTRVMRMAEDGSDVRQVIPDPILLLLSVSSDGRWASANIPAPDGGTQLVAFDLTTGKKTVVCRSCSLGIGPARIWLPPVQWSRDFRFMYFATRAFERTERTAIIPLHGAPLALDAGQDLTIEALRKKFGARIVNERDLYPGPDPGTYVFTRYTAQTNIYRVLLPPN